MCSDKRVKISQINPHKGVNLTSMGTYAVREQKVKFLPKGYNVVTTGLKFPKLTHTKGLILPLWGHMQLGNKRLNFYPRVIM